MQAGLRALWVLVALLPVVSGAAAQAPATPVPLVTVEAEPFAEPAHPLQGAISTNVTTRVSCALVEGIPGVPVTYSVLGAPPWANPTLSPATEVLPPALCEEGWLVGHSTLTVTVDDTAPARAPSDIVVEAAAGASGRQERANATVPIEAHFFSILEVQLDEAIQDVAVGSSVRFAVELRNLGNGPAELTFTLTQAPETVQAAVPEPFVLASRHEGAEEMTRVVEIELTAPAGSSFTNRVEVANYDISSAYADDPTKLGDAVSVSLLVTVKGEAAEKLAATPAPVVLALLALALAARAFRH